MIKGKQIKPRAYVDKPVMNYRKLDALNQSMLKLFDENPVQFFEEFKLGKKRKEKRSLALQIGDLVDFFLLECSGDDELFLNRMGEKFVLFEGKKGTGQVFQLADYLFDEAMSCTNEKGEVTCEFMTMFTSAFGKIQGEGKYSNKTIEMGLADFEKNGKPYYDKMMENIGKMVVETSVIDKSKIVAGKLLSDDFTRRIFKPRGDVEYFTHFGISWRYDLDEDRSIPCKSEIDMLFVNHEDKVIQPMDLKTTYDNEAFDFMYLKNYYYLQNSFYYMAVRTWARENEYADYEVNPMKFVVGDTSANNRRPLVYNTSEIDINNGIYGFDILGKHYRGVLELIEDIAWAEENNIWDCSKESYDRAGQMELNIRYDGR